MTRRRPENYEADCGTAFRRHGGLFIPFGNGAKCFFNTATGGDDYDDGRTFERARGKKEGEQARGQRTVLTISETPVGATWDGGYSTLEDAVGASILIEM